MLCKEMKSFLKDNRKIMSHLKLGFNERHKVIAKRVDYEGVWEESME